MRPLWILAVIVGLTGSALAGPKVDWSQYLEPPGQRTPPPKQATPVPAKQIVKKPAAKKSVAKKTAKAAPKAKRPTPRKRR